jgi:hypothetical protein
MSGLWMLPVACLVAYPSGASAQLQKLGSGDISVDTIVAAAKEFWSIIGPGGRLHPAYFLEHKGHLIIEGLLIAVILLLSLQRAFKPKSKAKAEAPLTDKVRLLWPASDRVPPQELPVGQVTSQFHHNFLCLGCAMPQS